MKAYEKHSHQAGNRGQTSHCLGGVSIYMYFDAFLHNSLLWNTLFNLS